MAQAENAAIGAGFSVPAIDLVNGTEEKSFIEAVRERRAERLNLSVMGLSLSFDATSKNSQSYSFKSAYDLARQRKLANSSWDAQPCREPQPAMPTVALTSSDAMKLDSMGDKTLSYTDVAAAVISF